ncbi:SCO family protein [Chitinophaga pinensis]|uniref:SCO family protein n=1 Tax=Chitinophaga pinensis TaxID=79329 RepID=UPI001C997DCF|nr:SCO family protein [Chitinophaga pinensis]
MPVTADSFADRIYVSDFMFLSCPTICPKMTKEMLKVYHTFEKDDRVALLSHTIDPEYDTIPRLKQYATSIGVRTSKWHFVTAPADTIYKLAASYYATAYPDSTAPVVLRIAEAYCWWTNINISEACMTAPTVWKRKD